jgi:hypothetical protein
MKQLFFSIISLLLYKSHLDKITHKLIKQENKRLLMEEMETLSKAGMAKLFGEGLKKTVQFAYLWQQSMPYFKAKKYEVGMKYLDKAVKYNPERWQSYRAFINVFFAKTYKRIHN